MNRILVWTGVVCLAAAMILAAWRPRPATAQPDPAGQASPTSAAGIPQPSPQSSPQPPPAARSWPTSLEPGPGMMAYADAVARPARTWPATAAGVVALRPMPDAGTGEVLYRANLGGVEVQRWMSAAWRIAPDGSVLLDGLRTSSGDMPGSLRFTMAAGVWTCQDAIPAGCGPEAADLVRTVSTARATVGRRSRLACGDVCPWAGEPMRVLAAGEETLLAATQDPSRAPAFTDSYPGPSGWNDVRIGLTAQGGWRAIERLTAAPGSREDPGFIVRRVLLTLHADDASQGQHSGASTRADVMHH